MLISRVVGIYRNRCIAEHGFGSCCGKLKLLTRLLYRVKKMPEIGFLFLIFNLGVGYRGITVRAPVYHTVAAINKPLVIELYKNLAHRLTAALVKSKAFSVPIAGGAHLFELLYYSAAVLCFPVPRTLEELISADVLLGYALFAHSLYYFGFRGY